MSLFATNRRTKKKFKRRKQRNGDRVKESEKLGSGYLRNESVI